VTEICQFFGGGWKVIIAVKQHSQPIFTVWNTGGGVILSKKTSQLTWRGPKKRQNKCFIYLFENP
jgi:transposase